MNDYCVGIFVAMNQLTALNPRGCKVRPHEVKRVNEWLSRSPAPSLSPLAIACFFYFFYTGRTFNVSGV